MSETHHLTHGPTRDSAIYVSYITRKGLNYVPKEPDETADSIAEQVLSDWLKANHPNIVQFIQDQHDREKAFRESLAKKPF